jgi:hypothetical protein
MSYNIDSIETLSGSLEIHASDLAVDQREWPPEDNFIEDVQRQSGDGPFGWLPIKRLAWSGEGSGSTEPLLKTLLSKTRGSAEFILCWEGGDSFSGLRVIDGVVTEHEVIQTLGEEV